jgi:hypothetical protein
MLISSSEQQLK